ncbi:MAG: LPS assembly lipoprotein LptE [Janthinobacterium lividum]
MATRGRATRGLATRRAVLLAAAGLPLAGCGFHPLYGGVYRTDGRRVVDARLDGIYVALIPNRAGQLLRQALQERLDQDNGVAKTLQLNATFAIDAEAIAVQQDNSTARTRVVGHVAWTLTSPAVPGSPIVTSGSARAVDGFNVVNEQFFFATLENEAATRRLADSCADQVAQGLAVYFRAHPETT